MTARNDFVDGAILAIIEALGGDAIAGSESGGQVSRIANVAPALRCEPGLPRLSITVDRPEYCAARPCARVYWGLTPNDDRGPAGGTTTGSRRRNASRNSRCSPPSVVCQLLGVAGWHDHPIWRGLLNRG